jgi:hypothetical protein
METEGNTLTLMNEDLNVIILEGNIAEEFNKVINYLADENGNMDTYQKVDDKFLKSLKTFDKNLIKKEEQEDFNKMFKLNHYFFMQYNISFFGYHNCLSNTPIILKVLREKNCSVIEAISIANEIRFNNSK